MTRFLNSLVRHICDTRTSVGEGFMLFALKVNPYVIKDIIDYNGNTAALSNALVHSGYPQEAAEVMAKQPSKFLWLELMKFWKGKTDDVVKEVTSILSKMDVLADPGPLMNKFLDIFNQRRLIVDLLLQAPAIRVALPRLLHILERLLIMQSATITSCLLEDSSKWEALTQ